MGVASNIETGKMGADEVDKIQRWIEGQHTQNDEKIKLVKSLEEFRRISNKERGCNLKTGLILSLCLRKQ
jgi:hypothetical protein